jgi:hypothetical protein
VLYGFCVQLQRELQAAHVLVESHTLSAHSTAASQHEHVHRAHALEQEKSELTVQLTMLHAQVATAATKEQALLAATAHLQEELNAAYDQASQHQLAATSWQGKCSTFQLFPTHPHSLSLTHTFMKKMLCVTHVA